MKITKYYLGPDKHFEDIEKPAEAGIELTLGGEAQVRWFDLPRRKGFEHMEYSRIGEAQVASAHRVILSDAFYERITTKANFSYQGHIGETIVLGIRYIGNCQHRPNLVDRVLKRKELFYIGPEEFEFDNVPGRFRVSDHKPNKLVILKHIFPEIGIPIGIGLLMQIGLNFWESEKK
jgi:hypothetical protein